MPETAIFEALAKDGVVTAILAVFLIFGYRLGKRLVDSHADFLLGLEKREIIQQDLCNRHASLMAGMTTMLTDRTPILVETRDGINRLVELSEKRGSPISTQSLQDALPVFKAAALQHCEMCRKIIKYQMPQISEEVCKHLDEMIRIVQAIEE